MPASDEDIRRLAQVTLHNKGFYSGDIDGDWGRLSESGFAAYLAFLDGREIGSDDLLPEEPSVDSINGVMVLDPGHGGTEPVGGSSPNNATSAGGVLERTMTLEFARLVRDELQQLAEEVPGSRLAVHLTRDGDNNLGLAQRAAIAAQHRADLFLSIHFNGFNGRARGTETLVMSRDNVNRAEDAALAQRVQDNLVAALRRHDPGARDRGVKDQSLGVLRDVSLGNRRGDHPTRACLVEVEFIDVPAVDELLNGPRSAVVKQDAARAVAEALVADLTANR